MKGLLLADTYRIFRKKWFWLWSLAMAALAAAFCVMQHTAIDYTVGIDRVIFLPMSFYGVAASALVSQTIGGDFDSGVLRLKLSAGHGRPAVYLSYFAASLCACAALFLITTAVSLLIALPLFEINVSPGDVLRFTALGILTSLSYGSIACLLSMLIGGRASSVAACTVLSFAMLFIALNTNAVVMQQPFKDGLPNPHYTGGTMRSLYEFLYDLNPTGQAAQLSSMICLHPARWISLDALLTAAAGALGCMLFARRDIR